MSIPRRWDCGTGTALSMGNYNSSGVLQLFADEAGPLVAQLAALDEGALCNILHPTRGRLSAPLKANRTNACPFPRRDGRRGERSMNYPMPRRRLLALAGVGAAAIGAVLALAGGPLVAQQKPVKIG